MSLGKKIWATSWRVLVCALLLLWVFHTIFLKEGKLASERDGLIWKNLTTAEQTRLGWHYGPVELWQKLVLIHPAVFAASVATMGLTIVLGVWRWRMALRVQGIVLPWARALEISFVAHFFNSFLLGSTGGDLMKAYYAARETHHKKTEAVVTVFVDRLIGLWAMLLFASLMMLPNLGLLFNHDSLQPLAFFILAMMLAGSLFVAVAFWGGVSKQWTGARNWLRRLPKGQWLDRSLESCRQFGKEPHFVLRMLGVSMILNAFCVVQVWILSWGLDLEIPPVSLFIIVPTIICISAIPITPSGLGVRESLFVVMLSSPIIMVPETSALSLSLLAYAGSLFWSLVGGLVYITFKQRHHLAEAELSA